MDRISLLMLVGYAAQSTPHTNIGISPFFAEHQPRQKQGAHFFSRHGCQTTLAQQFIRATTGFTPDGVQLKAYASSRFLTNSAQLEAFTAAEAVYTPALAGKGTVLEMNKIIGNGYLKGGGAIQTTTQVQVYYNSSGKIITLFPKL